MSKLFRLKEWLSISEAADYLSAVFREHASDADVLRLALDGHLKLSVNFVNHARARRGVLVPLEKAETWQVPAISFKSLDADLKFPENTISVLRGIKINDKEVLELERQVITLEGVYDLPLIGGERLDVEHQYQRLIGGPPVTLMNIDGALVQQDLRTFYLLQESYDDNEFSAGSRAAVERLEQRIAETKTDTAEAARLRKQQAEDRQRFLERCKNTPQYEQYYPAGGLPHDSVLVIRTEALRDLERKVKAMDTDIPAEFVTSAAEVLGATEGGLSGSMVVTVSAAIAYDRGVAIRHGRYPFEADNKRTAIYDNVMAFSGKDRFAILRALCDQLDVKQPTGDVQRRLTDLRIKLFTRYGHLAETPSHDINPAVVEETRHWLAEAPESLRLYNDALIKHASGAFQRNALDDLRLALELLLKRVLGNEKSLENQMSGVGKLLRDAGSSPELGNMFSKLLDYYSKYHNTYVKHDVAVNPAEMDFAFEITSAFMKQLVRTKRP